MQFLPLFSFSQTLETSEVFWNQLSSQEEDSPHLEFFQKSKFLIHAKGTENEQDNNLLSQVLFWLWDSARNGKTGSPSLAIVTNSLPTIHLMNKFKSRGYGIFSFSHLSSSPIPPSLFSPEFM
jgi:hypothetical protein